MFSPQIRTPDQLSATLEQVIHTQQFLVSLLAACLIPQHAFTVPTELYQEISTSWSPTSWPQAQAQQHGCCPQPEMSAPEAWTSPPPDGYFTPHAVYEDSHVACFPTTWPQTFDQRLQISPDSLPDNSMLVPVPAEVLLKTSKRHGRRAPATNTRPLPCLANGILRQRTLSLPLNQGHPSIPIPNPKLARKKFKQPSPLPRILTNMKSLSYTSHEVRGQRLPHVLSPTSSSTKEPGQFSTNLREHGSIRRQSKNHTPHFAAEPM